MEIRKRMSLASLKITGNPSQDTTEREFIYFKVQFNHFRDVSGSTAHEVLDREEPAECECVLCLPPNYRETGAKTPLILSFHGAGGKVNAERNRIGGVAFVTECIDAGYAALDVNGSELHGMTMGCPEHIFAIYQAYRYAITHYNLAERVFLAGASMGGHVAMNFANTFPGIVITAGLFCPRLNIDGVTVNDHYCIGTWDKTERKGGKPSRRERIRECYRFPSDEWCEENTVGFNPYRTRSFIDQNGDRVVMPPCPIKIWQGTEDATVDPVMVEEYARSVRRGGCYVELHMLEGVGHGVTLVMFRELLLWFKRFW